MEDISQNTVVDINYIPDCSKHLHFAKNIIFYPLNFNSLLNETTENNIPRIAHLIWVGDNPRPNYFDSNVNKWRELMPLWQIRVWTNADITLEHFPEKVIELLSKVQKGAQKADIMRYFIMEKYGGVYLDSDVTPHTSLESLKTKIPDAQAVLCHDIPLTWQYISIGFFAAVPNHPLFKLTTELVFQSTINTEDLHMHTGPRLLGEAVYQLSGHKIVLLPSLYFYHNVNYNERFGHHFYAKEW
jgi:mannosyltransferase OCH1-like enzyme